MVFLQGERNRSSGGNFEFSICPSLHLAHWLQNPHSYDHLPWGRRTSTWQRLIPRCSHTLCTAVYVSRRLQHSSHTSPWSLVSLREGGARPSAEQPTWTNSLVPASCSLPPGLSLPPNDLRSVVLRSLASGEASRDPLALTLGNRLVSDGNGWAHEPRVKTRGVHSETTSLHKTELLPLGPLLGY